MSLQPLLLNSTIFSLLCKLTILPHQSPQPSIDASAIRASVACCRAPEQKCVQLCQFLHKYGGFHLFALIPNPFLQEGDKAFCR